MPVQPGLDGGANSRSFRDTIAQEGPGLPDEAVGPEQRTLMDQIELAGSPDTDAIARKLASEVARWSGADEGAEVAPEDDPTGHA
jgi:hypothetical protein